MVISVAHSVHAIILLVNPSTTNTVVELTFGMCTEGH